MSGVYPQKGWGPMFGRLAQRVLALETQQQNVISDNKGRPVISDGLIPGTNPPLYGRMVWDPNTNTKLMFQGYDSGSDTAYTAFYNAEGNITNKFDQSGQHVYDASGNEVVRLDATGLHVYDSSDRNRVNAGELANGDYGLQVVDVLGNSEEILPAVEQYVDTEITVTNAGYISDGGPSVTVEVGASGTVQLKAASWISGEASPAYVGLFIDDVSHGAILTTYAEASGGTTVVATGNMATSRYITGLTPGSHTFELQYTSSSASVSVFFAARSLIVTPV